MNPVRCDNDQLRKLLHRMTVYTGHLTPCAMNESPFNTCSCGLQVLARDVTVQLPELKR
jgi:hypothetical protein